MTLQDLHDHLMSSFPMSIRKDLHTAIRVLAKALQYPDPHRCPLNQMNQPLPILYRQVESYLHTQGKSAHTIRNTKNNLSRLFRLAHEQALFSLSPAAPTPDHSWATRPLRPGGTGGYKNGTYLLYRHWPPTLQESYTALVTWATAPMVPGRSAEFKKRPSTLRKYREAFEAYFGFLHTVQQLSPLTFDHLFDITLVTAFVHWHVNELHQRATNTVYDFLARLLTLSHQYRPLPEFREQLKTLYKTLPTRQPRYNKEDAWVSLTTLDEIGRALWPRTTPQSRRGQKFVGGRGALYASLSLMFRLWTYVPLRQRNMREMKLGENLHKDAEGHWRITFQGEQLKIATRRGRMNIFDMPFPPALIPVLEAYLITWHPLLLKRADHHVPYVFLNERGKPWTGTALMMATSKMVYRYTGKLWHPHIVRTVWATEMILKGVDFLTVAKMLNDKVETVIANYAHLLDRNVAEGVYDLIDRHIGQGK